MSALDEVRDILIDMILEKDRNNYHNDEEPFDVYKEKIKTQCRDEWNGYFQHLSHGYDVIIDRITHDIEAKKVKAPKLHHKKL